MSKQVTQDDIIYFVVTDRFFGKDKYNADPSDAKIHGGTLDGIIEKLDYLLELGVTTIWVTPIYKNIKGFDNSEPYHYYWPFDFGQIDKRLLDGAHLPNSVDMSTFGRFVDLCEAKGMKVVLDMVVNHCGYGAQVNFPFYWFNVGGSGDIKGEVEGLPDFNHDIPEVVDFFIKNIEGWITKSEVINIRMDTVKHVEPKFWYYFKSQIRGMYPNVCLIGEVLFEGKDDVNKLLEYQNYHDFDSIFDFPLCTALRSTLIYDESLSYWLARPRLYDDESLGVLDDDNPLKGGYRDANMLVTLLDNHDLERRIMSHSRTKHPGESDGLDWAIKVTKLCLGALFTIRGIPQIYYGTEVGLEGWKTGDDRDLRRDFPWHVIGEDNHPGLQFRKEHEIYEWTRDLINLRKRNAALKYGATITLWSDYLVYAFLRIATDDVTLVIINNGYTRMPYPISLELNNLVIPPRVIDMITSGRMKHWKTGQVLTTKNDMVLVTVEGKTIDIFCFDSP